MKINVEEIQEKLKEFDLFLDEPYKRMDQNHNMHDSNGYKYYVQIGNIIHSNNKPRIVSSYNPYSIDNIRNYLKINNIDCELLSTEYINQGELLEWRCKCGNKFKKNWSHLKRGQQQCSECANKAVQDAKYIPKEYVKEELEKMNLYMIESTFTCLCDGFFAFTKEGYIVRINRLTLYNHSYPEIFHPLNPYTIYNINRYFDLYRNGEYKCISNNYINNYSSLEFIHTLCGSKFVATWSDMMIHNIDRREPIKCPKCYKGRLESFHASVLKQIFLKRYPDTSIEDKSCINPITNKVLPTDIVNHKLKIAIEIQSGFHDNEVQQKKDIIKKNYWISRGYKFYDPDIRDYTILEMIQLFFPNIYSIPDYIKGQFEITEKYDLAQSLIDEGKYYRQEIADKVGISITTLYYWNSQGKIKFAS